MEKVQITNSGKSALRFINDIFLNAYGNEILNKLEDSARLTINNTNLAFTTDTFTVKPIFFPGGDIGKLAICGTVNDLASAGARPIALSAGFVIEEGFPKEDLLKIVNSMSKIAKEVGVDIVAGDTKIVNSGDIDGIFINTSGIGLIMDNMDISCFNAKVGDDIIVTGSIGDHGVAILNLRQGLGFEPAISSDVASVLKLVESLSGEAEFIHVMRDPTRGGVANILNEIANSSKINIKVREENIYVKKDVQVCCDLLGLDPLYMANEGKLVLFVDSCATEVILDKLKSNDIAKDARVIGKVVNDKYNADRPPVYLETLLGSKRFLPLLEGEPVPRIC